MLKRIGLMCGTFDPPHIGHLVLAQTALTELALDLVLFLPVGDPTHKITGTPVKHRLKMVALAIKSNPAFALDITDATRPSPHYTATLLPIIQEKYPQAALWLIMGGDSLNSLADWHRPTAILSHCRLAVLARPQHESKPTFPDTLTAALTNKIDHLSGPSIQLSSSALRNQLRGQSTPDITQCLRYLVPTSVTQYIIEHRLYQQ